MAEGAQAATATKKRITRCGVYGCDVTSSTHPETSFYTVPKGARGEIWLKAIKAPYTADLGTRRISVCEKHFERKFTDFNCKRRRLSRWAVPTLFLPEKECADSFANSDDLQDSEGVSLDSDDVALNDDEEIPEENITVSNDSVTGDYIYPSIDKVTTLAPVKAEPIDPEAPSTSSYAYGMPVKRRQNENFENYPTKLVKIKQEKNCLSVFVDEDSEEEHHEDTVIANQKQDITEFQNQQNFEFNEKSSKQKYSTEYKMCALKLYYKSPNSYRLFQRTFSLPKISTLYRLCIPATTELNQDVLTALGIKVHSMTAAQKECVVCVGTMSITPNIEYDAANDKMFGFQELDGVQTLEPAKSILVIAVRGLFHNWKQALGFLLLSHFQNRLDVHRFIDEIIRKLINEINLNVRVLLTDLRSDMSSASWNRRFDAESPFFFIGKKKIYYMYEPLDLMKNVRDYFMNNCITFYNGMVAQWLHLVQCYEYDRKKKLMRLAPKLSEEHVNVKKTWARDDLKCTADIFSRATATAIATCIDLKVLDTQAKDTSLWILTMSQLLDILNFSTIDPPGDRSAVYSGTKKQVEFLVEMITLFSNLQTSHASFKEGFMVTINALLLLYVELRIDHIDCPPIIGLSHDCLNTFFYKCRHGLVMPPTAKQVVMTMTKLPIFNVFQYSLKKGSSGDLETFLSQVRQMPDLDMYEERAEPHASACAAACAEFPFVILAKDKKLEHLALYLLYKGYREHCECTIMKAYVRSDDIIENPSNVMPLVGYRTKICGSKYKLVPEEFVAFIEALEVKFKEYFKENRLARSIAGLMSFIQNVTFAMPCECFPLGYVKQLYLRYRLYNVFKYNNHIFRTENREATFVVNDL